MSGAPRLNRRLVLEERSALPDGAGGFAEGWREKGVLWAEISPRTGRDRAGEAVSLSSTSFRILLRAAPRGSSMRPVPGQRLREGARVFRLEAVTERGREGRYLVCFAEEEVAA
ncbi:head-tail adaptor protein [Aquicoccus sp. SCR17]|nr:head-tail adaptor protein [Carideicomes alvinocaridis]